jgi:DNA-binding GntR family transcriptional regulator
MFASALISIDMKSESLSGKVYAEMRRKILSNQITAGQRLKEDVWAKKMEVSRIAVREALNRLLGESLVEVGEKGGYFVKSMTALDVKEIRELREVLELGALRLAFEKIEPQTIEELEKICEDFTAMVQRGYLGGACEADVKFHETLILAAKNDKLIHAYKSSNIPLFHQKLGNNQVHMDDYEQTDQEHRQILEALKTGNLALAEATLSKHLIRGEISSFE